MSLYIPITGASSLLSSTTLAARVGRLCKAVFLVGRSWRSDARLRFLSILSDGIVSEIITAETTG
jgi:hypothetical protein